MLRICVVIFMAVLTGTLSSGWIAVSSVRSSNSPVEEGDSLLVMFWNIENMFDYRDSGTGESDTEFSSFGQRRWTKSRFYAKCNAIAKSVLWIADSKGRLPDVIGFAEVENAFAVRSIIGATALKKCGYSMVHFDSPDSRGIDVALLYRDDVFEKLSARSCHIYGEYDGQSDGHDSGPEPVRVQQEQEKSCCDNAECGIRQAELMGTRDILLVSLKHRTDGLTYHFLVNHHPSKYGGAKASEGRRRIAMRTLRNLCDSLSASGESKSAAVVAGVDDIAGPAGDGDVWIIAMGDFNDMPEDESLSVQLRAQAFPMDEFVSDQLYNLFYFGKGSYKYKGEWNQLDHFIVNGLLLDKKHSMHLQENGNIIYKPGFLLTEDKTGRGMRPFRTYYGFKYEGGYSDHLPLLCTFVLQSR